MAERFTFERGRWYGLTMFPGYFDCPYHSPIRVDRVVANGNRQFELHFFNLCYAAGVQNFVKPFETLHRTNSHLVAKDAGVNDRTYVFTIFNKDWLRAHFQNVATERYFDRDGIPVDQELLKLAATAN